MADDDDALTWDGDIRDPTHVESGTVADADAAGDVVDADADAPVTGSALLVVYGVLAGAYLLFVVGWFIGVQRDTFVSGTPIFQILYNLGNALAIVSPVLWFGTTLALTARRRPLHRVIWLIVGLPLVAPWPSLLLAPIQ